MKKISIFCLFWIQIICKEQVIQKGLLRKSFDPLDKVDSSYSIVANSQENLTVIHESTSQKIKATWMDPNFVKDIIQENEDKSRDVIKLDAYTDNILQENMKDVNRFALIMNETDTITITTDYNSTETDDDEPFFMKFYEQFIGKDVKLELLSAGIYLKALNFQQEDQDTFLS